MKRRLLIGLLLGAVVLVYANSLANQFIMDDELYILRNPQVTAPSIGGLLSVNKYANVFRPVSFATYALNWALGGEEPLGYHLVNLALHAGVTLLLYLLLLTALGPSPHAEAIALAAALLYAVLPIHTEAVDWAVGRAELLAAGLLLAAWILHLRDRTILSLLCFALALLSKESAVAFLPLVFVGDYATEKWKTPFRYALIAGITLLYLGVLWKVQGGRLGRPGITLDNPLASLPAGWRILNALRIAWKYVALQIYPRVLSCDYSFNQIPVYRDLRHTLLPALAAAVVAGVLTWALFKQKREWVLAGGIYFAGFAATANILLPTGTIFGERLAYLPSAGFCLALALAWNWLAQRQRILSWGLLFSVVLALSARTMIRNRDWRDGLSLYSAGVQAVPNDSRMHSNLANEYFVRNQLDLAEREYQVALRIYPDSPETLASYSALESRRGNYQSAGAMIEKAVNLSGRNDPHYDFMVVNFAGILMRTNHADAALDILNKEISEAPSYAPAWSSRAQLRSEQGETGAARADAEAALRLDPGDAQAQKILLRLDAAAPSDQPR